MDCPTAPILDSPLALDQLLDEANIKRLNLMLITGRCGSTWLAESLGRSGEVGRGDELFNPDYRAQLQEEFGVQPWADRDALRLVLASRSPRGVLWAQVGPGAFDFLTRHVISLRALASERVAVCSLDRRDRLAQAFSFLKAAQTGNWRAEQQPASHWLHALENPEELRLALGSWLVEIRARVDATATQLETLAAWGKVGPRWFYEDLVVDPVRRHLEVAVHLLDRVPTVEPHIRSLSIQRERKDSLLLRRWSAAIPELCGVHEASLGCRGVSAAVEALQRDVVPLDLSGDEEESVAAVPTNPEDAPRDSWSSHGEDLTLWALLERDGALPEEGRTGVFVDVGAYHPFVASNSALFELAGWKVVAVEPNPFMVRLWKERRPNSVVEQTAIGLDSGKAVLHFFGDWASSNTLRRDFAQEVATSQGLEQPTELVVPIVPLRDLLRKNLPCSQIDIISVDVEGMDEDVLRSNDWNEFRPHLVCVEDIGLRLSEPSESGVYRFLQSQDYELVSHVGLSSIYRDTRK